MMQIPGFSYAEALGYRIDREGFWPYVEKTWKDRGEVEAIRNAKRRADFDRRREAFVRSVGDWCGR